MLKRLYKLFHVDSVTKKISAITIIFGVLVFLVVYAFLPKVVYSVLRGYIMQPVALMVKDAASMESFNLVINSNTIRRTINDDNARGLLADYYAQPENRPEIKKSIQGILHHMEGYSADDGSFDPGNPYIPKGGVRGFASSAAIVSESGDAFCKDEMESNLMKLVDSEWYGGYRAAAGDGRRIYSPVFTSDDGIEFICYINTRLVGDMLFDFVLMQNASIILNAFRQLNDSGIDDVSVLGFDNEVLYSAYEESGFSVGSIDGDVVPQFRIFVYDQNGGVDFVTLASSIDEGLKLAVHAPESLLVKPFRPLILFVEMLLACSLLLFFFVMYFCVKFSLKNLKVLTNDMKKIQEGDYGARVRISSSDELETLGKAFNVMMERIVEHEGLEKERIMERERYKREMQYAILISEIDPHFIYNTLNSITYLAKLKRTDDIIIVNKALISMLKDRLKLKGYESFDLIKNEVEVIDQYIIIQNFLYADKIKMVWEIDGSLMTEQIPKNVLQPLVENAILHGLLVNMDGNGEIIPGQIAITITKGGAREGFLRIAIKDTGVGMGADEIAEYFDTAQSIELSQINGDNIGIKNIIQRLNYLYGNNWGIKADGRIGMGMAVEITIPLRR